MKNFMGSTTELAQELAIDGLKQNIDQILEQCRRFEEMAEILATMVDAYDTTHMAIWLGQDDMSEEEIELVLVALALKGSPQSACLLDAYESAEGTESHRIFHRLASLECERRRRQDGASSASAFTP